MKALILVGGFGTRLRPLTVNVPKSLVKFCGRPMVEWQIAELVKIGVTDIVLAICYKEQMLKEFINEMNLKYKINIHCSVEKEPLNTGGPIKLAEKYLRSKDKDLNNFFFVLNSDIICQYPFEQMIKQHKEKKAEVSILVTKVEDPSRFGIVVHDKETKRVSKFVEKPKVYVGDHINAGIYIFNESVLDQIELKNISLEREIFPNLAAKGNMFVMQLEGFWKDIGLPHDFILATKIMLKHFVNVKMMEFDGYEVKQDENNFKGINLIHKTAKINEKAFIGPFCVIHPRAEINEGVRVSNSIIKEETVLHPYCHVFNSIISRNSSIGKWARVDKQSILAEKVLIGEDISIQTMKMDPESELTYQP